LESAPGDGPDDDRLDNAGSRYRGSELREFGLVELRACLERIAVDLADGDFEGFAGGKLGRWRRRCGCGRPREEGFEALAECAAPGIVVNC
jgi:hypothetical protein